MTNYKFLFYALLISSACLLSCVEKQPIKTRPGELIASSTAAIAETEAGKVAGYIDEGIFIFKGIPYAQAERFA